MAAQHSPRGGARKACLDALAEWRARRSFADAILHAWQKRLHDPSDRAFLTELFYGILRNLSLLDFWIETLSTRPPDIQTRDVLRMGLYQTLLLHSADHAAVNETVAVARKQAAGFVNAVLRESLRRRKTLMGQLPALLPSLRWSHPAFLYERWKRWFGEPAASALCEWNNTPPQVVARVNTLVLDRPALLERASDAAQPGPHPLAVVMKGAPGELIEKGWIYVQDTSAMRVVDMLNPQPGERILDVCAAPGGKTTDIAARMRNDGTVVATDPSEDRLHLLKQNCFRLGVSIVRAERKDWLAEAGVSPDAEGAMYDRVLVDAPCSNSGVLRRRVDARWRLRPEDFEIMPDIQRRLLTKVAASVKPGGVLVYSTCSIDRDENEAVAAAFAAAHPEFEFETGFTSLPPSDGMDGGFASRWRRKERSVQSSG